MKTEKIIPYVLIFLLGLSGCAFIENGDELSVMEQYSREKDGQYREVKVINDHYDILVNVIAQGHISDYKDKASFVHSFGEPILKKDVSGAQERWLYRYAIDRLAKDKVYVYFDRDGKLVKWEKLPCPKLF